MGTSTVYRRARPAATLILAVFLIVAGKPVLAADAPKTVALVDFVVRAPAAKAAENAWLGPAVAELLQAKMQLLDGARVVERMRLRSLISAAGKGPDGPDDTAPAYLAVLPAEILIAGSVEVSPGAAPAKIRFRARAFETQTARILSQAVFEGTSDLAGLLEVSQELAEKLVDGLGLAFAPGQVAYAEPASIDTLKRHLAGNEHFLAGRYRQAIASYQEALDGNGGKYYAAAHRMQGEAYQTLSKSGPDADAQHVNEEYLNKFQKDALAASGAIFDLGLAYEANALWKEAVAAFQDYVTALKSGTSPVRWSQAMGSEPRALVMEEDRLMHSVRDRRPFLWETRDAKSGQLLGKVPLGGIPLARYSDEETWRLKGIDGERYVFLCRVGTWKTGRYWVVVLGRQGALLWSWPLEMERVLEVSLRCGAGRVYLGVEQETEAHARKTSERNVYYGGDKTGRLYTFDVADGRLLSAIDLEMSERVQIDLRYLDMAAATYSSSRGVHDLARDLSVPYAAPAVKERNTRRGQEWWKISRPTGYPRINYLKERNGVRLYRDGQEVFFLAQAEDLVLPVSADYAAEPPPIFEGPILFSAERGYLLVNPQDWTTVALYQDYKGENFPYFVARSASHLAFVVSQRLSEGEVDVRYGLATGDQVLNILDVRTGRLEAKYRLNPRLYAPTESLCFLVGDDLVIQDGFTLRRIGLLEEQLMPPASATSAGLHVARCLLEQGDHRAASEALNALGRDATSDPRGKFLRLRIAKARGAVDEAVTYALKALSAGGVEDKAEAELCLEAIRERHTEVKDLIRIPVKGHVEFTALAAPGKVVAALQSGARCGMHFLIDLATGLTQSTDTPELNAYCRTPPRPTTYLGRYLYGPVPLDDRRVGVVRVDLSNGARIQSAPLGRSVLGFVRGMEVGAMVFGEDQRHWLVHLDPETLQVLNRIDVEYVRLLAEESGFGIFAWSPSWDGESHVIVVDLAQGREVFRKTMHLKNEKFIAATSDGETLYLGITGGDHEALLQGMRGLWLRVEAIQISPRGVSWTFEEDGFFAGNFLLEGDLISFPAYEGGLPVKVELDTSGKKIAVIRKKSLPLKKLSLQRATGKRVAEEAVRVNAWDAKPSKHDVAAGNVRARCELTWAEEGEEHGPTLVIDGSKGWKLNRISTVFSPPAFRHIFAGSRNSAWHGGETGSFWDYRDDREPLPLVAGGPNQGYYIARSACYPGSDNTLLVEKGRVYEPIGGGYILVKDYADGKGLDDVYPPWKQE